jgi:hypothetical protein
VHRESGDRFDRGIRGDIDGNVQGTDDLGNPLNPSFLNHDRSWKVSCRNGPSQDLRRLGYVKTARRLLRNTQSSIGETAVVIEARIVGVCHILNVHGSTLPPAITRGDSCPTRHVVESLREVL